MYSATEIMLAAFGVGGFKAVAAMWSIFQLQDLLGMSEKLRRQDPHEERINVPANSNHYWNYRMHLNLEQLIKEKEFNEELKDYITNSGRA